MKWQILLIILILSSLTIAENISSVAVTENNIISEKLGYSVEINKEKIPVIIRKTTFTSNSKIVGGIIPLKSYKHIDAFSAKISAKQLEELKNEPGIEIYNDSKIKIALNKNIQIIKADKALAEFNITGKNQAACLIDTGVDYLHPALGGCLGEKCKIIAGYDFVNSDNDPMDDHGHGTHIAGIIISNDTTYKGVAPGANIVALKIIDNNGDGYLSDLIAAIDYCIDKKEEYNIKLISLSLADENIYDECENTIMGLIIKTAKDAGIITVAASGNEFIREQLSYPACVKESFSVGASNNGQYIEPFTNIALDLDIIAPGIGIYSSLPQNSFGKSSGTSMAVPFVSGSILLLYDYADSKKIKLTPYEIEELLRSSGNPLTLDEFTIPHLNVYNAIHSIKNPLIEIILPENNFLTNNSTITFEIKTNFKTEIGQVINNKNTKFCSTCNNISKKVPLHEALNTIKIYAQGYGGISTKDLNITLDSKKPVASQKIAYQNATFKIKYSEENLQSISLILNNSTYNKTNCPRGKFQYCEFNPDLGTIEQEYNYYFELMDYFSTTKTTISKIFIDTKQPELNINSPQNNQTYGKNIFFNITLSEKADLSYEKDGFKIRLCTKCTRYEGTKFFKAQKTKIKIIAQDSAINIKEQEISLNVI